MITGQTALDQFEQELRSRGLRCTMLSMQGELWWCTVRDARGIAYEGTSITLAGAIQDALDLAGDRTPIASGEVRA